MGDASGYTLAGMEYDTGQANLLQDSNNETTKVSVFAMAIQSTAEMTAGLSKKISFTKDTVKNLFA